MTTLSSLELQSYLPHRYPFLLIDKIIEIIPEKTIIAIKNVTLNEPFFQGHFPENPVMPGVLILEAMGQTISVLASYTKKNKGSSILKKYVFASMDRVKFKAFVLPGDQLKITAQLKWRREPFVNCEVHAMVNDDMVCIAQMTCAEQFTK